jgi:hypothetical protein
MKRFLHDFSDRLWAKALIRRKRDLKRAAAESEIRKEIRSREAEESIDIHYGSSP